MTELFDKATVPRLLGELERGDRRRMQDFGASGDGHLNPPLPVS